MTQDLFTKWQQQGSAARASASILRRDTLAAKFKSLKQGLRKALSYETHIEMLNPLKKLTNEAQENLGRQLEPGEDPYFIAKALRASHDARTRVMVQEHMIDIAGNPVGPPLADIYALVKDRRDDFTIYLWAKRARALWLDPKREGRNPGLSLEDADQIIKELETTKFQLAAQKVYDWQDGVLNYAAQGSISFAKAVEKIRAADPGYYIPLQREFRKLDSIWGRAAGRARAVSGNLTARLKGSGRRILDPFPQMISNTRGILKAAHHRMVIDQMIKLSKIQGMGHLVEKVPKEMVPQASRTIQELMDEINRKLRPTAGVAIGGDIDTDVLSETVTFFTPAQFPKGQDPIIPISTQGKIEWYQFDHELYNALASMEVYRLPSIGAFPVLDWIFGKPARLFRAGTTGMRATFGLITNPLRDVQTLYINSQVNVNALHLLGEWVRSMANAAIRPFGGKPDPYLGAFIRLGGEMAQPLGQDIPHTQRAARQLFEGRVIKILDPRNWLDWYRDLVQFPESAARVTELRTLAKETGWEPGQPMTLNQSLRLLQAAKEVTTDFTAASEFARVMNQIIPFFNAAIQGPRANVRAAFRGGKPSRRFFMRGLILTAATIALWWKHKDEDWYKEMGSKEKFGYWHFPTDWPEKTLIRIPKSFEVGAIFSALPEAFLDAWYRQNPEAVIEWAKYFIDLLSPVELKNPLASPVLLREFFEQARNKSYYLETPVVSKTLEDKPKEEQFDEYTSRLSITLGQIFKQSPERIDHVINGIFGGAAGDIIDVLGLGAKGVDRESEAADIPVIGRLFQRGGELGTKPKSIQKMYNLMEQAKAKQHSDKNPETADERQLRLVLTDATRSVSLIQYIRSQTKEVEKRQALTREALSVSQDAVRKYTTGEVRSLTMKQRKEAQKAIMKKEAKKSTDPITQAIAKATSNNQKLTVLNAVFDDFEDQDELKGYLRGIARQKLISVELAVKVLKDYRSKREKSY